MAMDWLKGLVGPVAQFSPAGQPMQGGAPGGSPAFPPAYGGAPPGAGGPAGGGAPPPGAWGPPPGAWDPNAPPQGAGPAAAADPGSFGGPGAYSPPPATYGAPSYGAATAYNAPGNYGAAAPSPSGGGAGGWSAAPQGGADARIAQLENRCEELRRDLESVALFAQTLLAVLEDKKVMTQQDFQEMRRKLDLVDGRLDDRIGKPG
jgi:hypothetical protein